MALQIPRDFRRVIIAASVGNVIEWYDFYIFGSLAAVLSVKFFEQSHPVAALLSTIALFTAGFLIRPLGAFLFGWMGDRIGRKYTFLVSFLLVAIAIYIRLQLQETPIFQEIKAKGQMTRTPWKEAFLSSNIKYILIATIVLIGQGVVWYSGQFWALYFLQQVSKVDPLTSAYIVGAALLIATPSLIFFGWLSDIIGRKPVILGGMLLAAITYYPLYLWLGTVTQPGNINYPIAIFIIFILVCYVGMVYGPVGAFLSEYFPGRIRYTSVSVPHHICNGLGGGVVAVITSAAFAATRSIGYALMYPSAVPAACLA